MVYILPFLAIAIGWLLTQLFPKSLLEKGSYLLSFSGAFLLSITLFELLPHVFETPNKKIGLFIMGGILLQIILDFFTKGAEHGHVHHHGAQKTFPWLLFLGLSIHSIIEGFPATENNDVLWGVVIHKIPIAMILSLFFKEAGYERKSSLLFLLLFALMTPLGSMISLKTTFFEEHASAINAIAIGVFLHVSTTILFESSKDHKFNLTKLVTILVGVLLAYLL